MLQKLNERIQGVVAWLVIILIAITFTLFGVDYYLQAQHTTNDKVTINGQPLSTQAFEINYRRARSQQDLAQMTAADEKKLQNQVLDQMIANEVTMQSARQHGFAISLSQANAAIVNIPQFQEDGHFSSQRYQQALSGALFTPDTFQSEVRQGMLLNQQRFAFIGSSFALSDEIERFVTLYMQTRNYDFLTIPSSRFEKQVQVKITADEMKEYYKNHLNEFMLPEQVNIEYVSLSMHDIMSKIKISKEQIKRYYNENQNNYLTPAQWQVAHILFSVPENSTKEEIDAIQKKAESTYADLQKNPQQFDLLVERLSDDKLSLADKGILPWLTAGQNEFDKSLAQLTIPGQISPPEKTKLGFELFKLIAYKPVSIKPLSAVETIIKEQLASEMAQAQYAHDLEQLSDLSYQTPDSLAPVAAALKLKVQKSGLFSHDGGKSIVTKNKQVINTAFSQDVLVLGNNSEPVQIDNDSVIVLRVSEHFPAKEENLASAQPKIKKILTQKFAQQKAIDLGYKLLNSVEEKQQELISANQLEWHSVTQASRDNDKSDAAINELAFNLLKSESSEGLSLANGDYVVVKLKQINVGELSSLDTEHRNSLIQQIESSYGMMDYDLYVASLMKHAQIARY